MLLAWVQQEKKVNAPVFDACASSKAFVSSQSCTPYAADRVMPPRLYEIAVRALRDNSRNDRSDNTYPELLRSVQRVDRNRYERRSSLVQPTCGSPDTSTSFLEP